MYNDNSSEDEADVYHEAHALTAPTVTVIERPNPETLELIDTSTTAQPQLLPHQTLLNFMTDLI